MAQIGNQPHGGAGGYQNVPLGLAPGMFIHLYVNIYILIHVCEYIYIYICCQQARIAYFLLPIATPAD